MSFASFPYLLFLLTIVCIYFGISKKYSHVFLLFSSYLFYAFFGFGFLALMVITTVITFTTSYYCFYADKVSIRKLFFYLGLGLDLLIFILFKYIHIIDIDVMNWPNWSVQKLLIPIGISFYTFKTIGYCIDVYKRKYPPESSFVYYALSVSFFPQLIAGPIEKSVVISSQLKQKKTFNIQNVIEGSKLILWGLFKKIVIADGIGQIISPVLSNIHHYNGIDFFIVFIAFAYQVYSDFSGYSDIAIGSAMYFGIKLPANFNKPFFSKNYRKFWTRWHITFSKWLKEYIFDELGRSNRLRLILNLWILFIIVGLWHGATLNFIIYAQIAFLFLLIDIATKTSRQKIFSFLRIKNDSLIIRIISYLAMIFFCMLIGIFYGLPSFSNSIYVLKQMVSSFICNISILHILILISYILLFEFFQYFQITADGHCFQRINNFYFRVGMYLVLLFSILLFSSKMPVTFQYFQF